MESDQTRNQIRNWKTLIKDEASECIVSPVPAFSFRIQTGYSVFIETIKTGLYLYLNQGQPQNINIGMNIVLYSFTTSLLGRIRKS